MPIPQGPNSDRYVFTPANNSQFVLPSNNAHPEGKVELIKYLWHDVEAYEENLRESFAEVAREERDYEMFEKAQESYQNEYDPAKRILPDSVGEHIEMAVEGEMVARAALEAVADEAQAAIDDVLNDGVENKIFLALLQLNTVKIN
ncbi:MAG: hypothetical protein ACOC4G_12385 [Bacillota bacterium]